MLGHAQRGVPPPRQNALGFVFIVVAALAVFSSFAPFDRPSMFDPATWEYNSLALLDGRVPYRDFFLHKTPGAAYVGLIGAAAAKAAGYAPILGIRAVFLTLGALGPALLFLLCVRAGCSRAVAVLAAAWLLAYEPWSLASIEGARPKIATTAFGLACLLASPRKPFSSGLLGTLAALCWQPGVVFSAAALLASWKAQIATASSYERRRWLRRYFLGASLPALALMGILSANGAVTEFFAQTIAFNFHYVESGVRLPFETLDRLTTLLLQWNRPEAVFFGLALVGVFFRGRNVPAGLGIATTAYLGLTFFSLQAWPDLILFGPGLAAITAVGLAALIPRSLPRSIALTALVVVAIGFALWPRSGRFHPPISFDDQRVEMEALGARLDGDDTVYVVSCPEFLVHTGRHSVLPWPYMWFGVDHFASSRTSGGFEGILAQLESASPALMLVCRRWNGPLRRRFEEWSAAYGYSREETHPYPHTKRPMVVYRRDGGDRDR